jgi:NAD/NADP transhydrogenase beta subunit
MRERLAGSVGAVVVVGGRVAGQQGLLPGVIEEVMTALATGVPLFVAGGFGGCGRIVARALQGEEPEELSLDYQRQHTDQYAELLDAAERVDAAPDYGALVTELSVRGVGGLKNKLDESENRRLLSTDDVDEMIALVLRGLFKIADDAER